MGMGGQWGMGGYMREDSGLIERAEPKAGGIWGIKAYGEAL